MLDWFWDKSKGHRHAVECIDKWSGIETCTVQHTESISSGSLTWWWTLWTIVVRLLVSHWLSLMYV